MRSKQAHVKESFGNWFHDRYMEAGLRNRSAHGPRKVCVVKLISIGCTPHEMIRKLTVTPVNMRVTKPRSRCWISG
jgi:hypothetical protein